MNALGRLLIACALAAVLSGLTVCGLAARAYGATAPSGVTISVQAGYEFAGGGNYRVTGPTLLRAPDVWVPIHVTLHNSGTTNLDGRLQISDNTPQPLNNLPPALADYTLDVALPAGTTKMVEMYVRGADLDSQLAVNLTAGGTVVASSPINASAQPGGDLSVGVLSDDTSARTALRALKFGDIALSVTQFDNAAPLDTQPQALQNFDLIIITNFSSDTLSAAQLDALRDWVQGGGALLVAGGPDADKTMRHLPADLLAATLRPASTQVVRNLPELAQVAGDPVGPSGAVEISAATARPGATVAASYHGIPLAADLPLGRGHVVYSALEPALAPFNNWSLTAQSDYWRHVLASALAGPTDTLVQSNALSNNNGGNGDPYANIVTDLGTPPSRTLPSLPTYAFLIVLYILVLGPLNFVLLRTFRRMEMSWLSVPVIALVFGIGSFGLAYARNGGDVLANVDTVLYLDPGSTSKLADSYIGLFAPYQADYTLSSSGPALAWDLGANGNSGSGVPSDSRLMRVDEGPQFNAWLYGVQMWSMRAIGLRHQIDVPGAISGRLVLRNNAVSGDITNSTNLTLRDCAIVSANGNSGIIRLLAPGQTAHVAPFNPGTIGNALASGGSGSSGPLTNLYAASGSDAPGLNAAGAGSASAPERYSNLLNGLFPSGSLATAGAPAVLIGWSSAPLTHFTVNGSLPHRADLDLVIAPLDVTAAPGHIAVAPGALPVGVIDTTVSPQPGDDGAITLNPGDHIDLQVTLPAAGHRVHVDTMTVEINTAAGSSLTPTSAQLWNWVTHRWVSIDASSGVWNSKNAAAFAAPDGRVWLRIVAPSQDNLSLSNLDQSVGIGATAVVSGG